MARVAGLTSAGGGPDDLARPRSGYSNNCLEPGCSSKPFKRKADLERHYQNVHRKASAKKSYPCDYRRCLRSTEYFYRLDHCRDHYREYHKEDLCRRAGPSLISHPNPSIVGGKKRESRQWWADRAPGKKWWRCSKCLRRVYIDLDGFECRNCRSICEMERRNYRGYK